MKYRLVKHDRCDCGRDTRGSRFYQDHGSCEHCYYGVEPDPERSEGKVFLRASKQSLKEATAE